jgi:hypothetical protein
MLTKGDDYPLHQTPEPMAYVGGNRNFYDRYFFNGYNADGSVFFAFALGVYPYVDVMDSAFSVVIGGQQRNVIASKTMTLERLDTSVGPLALVVETPLERLRIRCDDTESGLHCDLVFTAFIPAHEEPRFVRRQGSQLGMDLTRMMQNGSWSGTLVVDGQTYHLTDDRFIGTRDRSWGLRNIGAPDAQPNPGAGNVQFYWIWAPMNFEDFSIHYFVNQDEAGDAWNENAVLIPKLGGGPERQMKSYSYDCCYESGTRFASSALIKMVDAAGDFYEIEMRPQWNFYMKGLGYGHETHRHGSYHGALSVIREQYSTESVTPDNIHVQAFCDVTLKTGKGESQGKGVLEQLVIGPHQPSGFSELMDFAS